MADRLALFTGGVFAESHAKTAHGILRYGDARGRRASSTTRQAGARRVRGRAVRAAARCRSWPSVAEAVALGANVLVIGVAPFGGALTAEWRAALLEAIAAGLDVEAGLHTVLARGPGARRGGAPRRASSCATCARRRPGLSVPARPAERPGRAGRAHRRLGLRDRQDVGDAGARRRRPRARAGVGVRGHRADRDRDHRLGDRRRPRDLGLHLRRRRRAWSPRAPRARRCCSSRARARSGTRPTPASRWGCCTAACPTRSCSATGRARRSSTTTRRPRSRRWRSWSRSTRARSAGSARRRVRGDRAQHARAGRRRGPRGDRAAASRDRACPRPTRCASAPSRSWRRSCEPRPSPPTSTSRCATAPPRASGPSSPADAPGAARVPRRALSENSRWLRFFSLGVNLDKAARGRGAGDRPEGYGLIVTTGAEERVVAHAVFELERPDRAEVAFAVADEMQGRGLATVLIAHLAQVASARGVTTFTATVLPENRRMISVFRESGFPVAGARLAGRDRARVPDRAGRGRAAQVRGPRPGRRRRGGRAGAAAALGGRDRRLAAAGLLRRRGVPARAGQRLPRRALPGQPERGLHRQPPRGAVDRGHRPGRSTSRSSPCPRRRVPGGRARVRGGRRRRARGHHRRVRRGRARRARRGSRSCSRPAARAGCGSSGPNCMGVVNTRPGGRR